MSMHIPTPLAPTSVIPTVPSQQNPDTQSNIAAGTGPTFGPISGGIPVITGNAGATTNPPVLACLSQGQVSHNANPTNAMFAAGLTSILAQMATGQLSGQTVLTVANPTNHNGH